MIGYRVLEGTGVAPHSGERLQMAEATSSETGYKRQARMVATVLLAAHENFGIALPQNVQAALAADSEACKEGAKTSQAKLLRK
jgi:hypothetical protein